MEKIIHNNCNKCNNKKCFSQGSENRIACGDLFESFPEKTSPETRHYKIAKIVKPFLKNRFSDSEAPRLITVMGVKIVTVYYAMSDTYSFSLNGKTNYKQYVNGNYLVNKIIREVRLLVKNS